MKNLPMDLLRTFTTVKDLGGFTQAGELLGRSQPAVSLQMKRLEEMLDAQLFKRAEGMKLTEEGNILYTTARKILSLNDSAVSRITTPSIICGSVRIGTPNDFEVSFLPVLLSKFTKAYPDITLDVTCDVNSDLRKDYKKGAYDFVLSMDEYPDHDFDENDFIVEPLSWISAPDFKLEKGQPVPLVLYPEGCIYRKHITDALAKANIPWRIHYCSTSLSGIQSAIREGLGISAIIINTIPETFKTSLHFPDLPDLGNVSIGFNYDENSLSPAAKLLLDSLKSALNQNHQFPPIPIS